MAATRGDEDGSRTRFFGSLPVDGIWTSVGFTREQFLTVVSLSTFLFLFIEGPLWDHLRDSHLARVVYSYAVIPPAVAGVQYLNGKLRWGLLIAATVVVALVKLVITAVIVVAIGLTRA